MSIHLHGASGSTFSSPVRVFGRYEPSLEVRGLSPAAFEPRSIPPGDGEALHALRVTREERETLFWPELPESRRLPFEFAWGLLKVMDVVVEREGRWKLLNFDDD